MSFLTDAGERVPAVTAQGMREVDRVAVEDVGLSLLGMMENAGRNLAGNARELSDGPVAVFAGSGGNGGGGLCCARHLRNHGVEVRVVLDRDPSELDGAARRQFDLLRADGVAPEDGAGSALRGADLAVDALIGYGLSGAPRGRAADLIGACAGADRVLSLDVPSGVDADTGEAPGAAVVPDRTLTLALPKAGLADAAGELYLGDIAIPSAVFERAGVEYASPFDGEYWIRIRADGEP